MQQGFIKYFVIILVILAIVFLSQQMYFKKYGKQVSDTIAGYVATGSDWAKSHIYPKISGEVQKRGETITNEVAKEKEKITESIGEKISNYFSGISDAILHPSDSTSTPSDSTPTQNNPAPDVQTCNCPACPTTIFSQE